MATPTPTPSPYMITVARRYSNNFGAIQDYFTAKKLDIEPIQLVAMAAVTTLLDFLAPIKQEQKPA